MNTTETPPPAPDPFEAIAQQLAMLAAGLIQVAGQIANLRPPKDSGDQLADELAQDAADEAAEKEDAKDSPEAQPESEESTQEEPPAESPANEQEEEGEPEPESQDEADEGSDEQPEQDTDDTDDTEQPDADDLQPSDQDGEGEELDEAPDAPAEEQPAESDTDDEPSGETTEEPENGEPTEGREPTEGDGEPEESDGEGEESETTDSDAQEADGEGEGETDESEGEETEDAPEGAESTEEGDGTEPGDAETGGDGDADHQPAEQDQEQDYDPDKEPEHVDSNFDIGEGSGHDDEPTDEDGPQIADNDGRGEAAALPPDLPPLDSTLANCSPPPAPEAVPYRPLDPISRKCADILTGALGKRFALPRADRHTGQLSAQAVARHAPDVFRRRPRREGSRPKLTVILDTSTSMLKVFEKQGQFLVDGLLEAHRRRVIDLRLYDSRRAGWGAGTKAEPRRFTDSTGLFSEAKLKEAAAPPKFGKPVNELKSYADSFKVHGALVPDSGSEGFAPALENLQGVILDSDATIMFTDGHWTDGALDKVKYQMRGVEVVGLYIPLEFQQLRDYKAGMRAKCKTPDQHKAQDDVESAMEELLAFCTDDLKERTTNGEMAEDSGTATMKALVKASESKLASRIPNYNIMHAIFMLAASRIMLEMNSHRSYCVETAVECAQAIVQEIARQIETK